MLLGQKAAIIVWPGPPGQSSDKTVLGHAACWTWTDHLISISLNPNLLSPSRLNNPEWEPVCLSCVCKARAQAGGAIWLTDVTWRWQEAGVRGTHIGVHIRLQWFCPLVNMGQSVPWNMTQEWKTIGVRHRERLTLRKDQHFRTA